MAEHDGRKNPSAPVDLTSSSLAVSEIVNLLEEQSEETLKLKAAAVAAAAETKRKADQAKAKTNAEQLTSQLIKHASNIRDGDPRCSSTGKVPAAAAKKCGASLEVRSLPLSLPLFPPPPNANR